MTLWRPSWDQTSRATKHFAALAWATLELWRWGARPQALTFIAAVLGASEAFHIARRVWSPPDTRTSQPSQPSSSGPSSHG